MIHVEAASRNARGVVYNPNAMYPKSIQDLEELYAKQMASDLSAYLRLSDGSDSLKLRSIWPKLTTIHAMEKHLGKLIEKAIVSSQPLYFCRIGVSLIDEF